MTQARPVLIDAASVSVRSGLQYVVAFAASAALSRALGPEGRGIYYLPVLTATALVAATKLGLDQATIYLAGSRALPLPRLSAQNGLVALVMGTTACLCALAVPHLFPATMRGTSAGHLLLAGLTIPFTLHAQYSAVILSLAGNPAWQYRAGTVAAAAQLLLIVGLAAAGGLTVEDALLATLAAAVVNWVIMVRPLRTLPGPWLRWDPELLRLTLRGALVLHLGMVLLFFHLRAGMFIVRQQMGDAALGHYSLAVVLAETTWLVTDAVALVLLPRQVGTTLEDAAQRSLRAARANVVLGLAACAVWLTLGRPLIVLVFGSAFAPAYAPLVALLPGIVLLGVQRACSAPTLRAGRPWPYTGIYAVGLACNIVLTIWWIPRWGLTGAAAAWTVSGVASAALFAAWTLRLSRGGRVRDLFVPTAGDWDAVRTAGAHLLVRFR